MCHSQTKVGVSVLLIFIQIEKWTRFLVCTLFRVKLHCSQMTHDAPYKCDTTHMTQMNNQKSEKQQSRTGNRVYLRTAQAQRERYQNACVLCALVFFFISILFGHLSPPVICSNWVYFFTRHSSPLYSYFIKCVTISRIFLLFHFYELNWSTVGRLTQFHVMHAQGMSNMDAVHLFVLQRRRLFDVRKVKKKATSLTKNNKTTESKNSSKRFNGCVLPACVCACVCEVASASVLLCAVCARQSVVCYVHNAIIKQQSEPHRRIVPSQKQMCSVWFNIISNQSDAYIRFTYSYISL